MRELVDDDVPAIVRVGGAAQHIVPGQDDLALLPGFAGAQVAP